MAIDGPHGTAMAIDELRWDLSTGQNSLVCVVRLRENSQILGVCFKCELSPMNFQLVST